MRPRTASGRRPPHTAPGRRPSPHRARPQAFPAPHPAAGPPRTAPGRRPSPGRRRSPHRYDDPRAAPVILASPLTWYWPSAWRRLAPFFPPPVRRN